MFAFTHLVADYIKQTITDYTGLGTSSGILGLSVGWLVSILVTVIFYFINATFNKYIMLILMSPIMAILSEKTEQQLTGKTYPFNMQQLVRDIFRGILIALRNMLIEYGIIILSFFLLFIPVIGWLFSVFFLALVSYYFYGYSMMDYCAERKRMGVMASSGYIWKNKWLAVTNGFVFWIIFSLPLIGSIFAPVLAPVAAAIAVNHTDKNT